MRVVSARLQAVLTGVCLLALVGHWVSGWDWAAHLSVLAGSVFAFRAAWASLRDRSIDVNVLMVLAAAGSVLLGHPAEAAVLLFLFSLSHTLEEFTLGRTKSAIEGLIALRPETAVRLRDDGEETVRVEALVPGDRVRVKAFETVPVDGRILTGDSHVNEGAMTGEPVPVTVSEGSEVLGGTQNEEGMFTMEVLRASGQTTLDKVVELVRDAQENKASGERVSQWFGQRYTIFVIVAFLVSLGLRTVVGQEWGPAAYASLTLLVALSPCALVISVPATTLSAMAWAARNGILIRGGQAIEEAGRVDTVTLDKTGTLTVGRPVLAEICVCTAEPVGGQVCQDEETCWSGGDMSGEAQRFLQLAAVAEQYSEHPIARAIVGAAKEQGLDVPEGDSSEVVPGLGIRSRWDGVEIAVGQARFFPDLPSGFQAHADELRRKGMTVAIGRFGDDYAAFGLQDSPRGTARWAVSELRGLGVSRVLMLTGDNAETAEAVAGQVGVNEFRAGLFPADKEGIIGGMVDEGRRVMMVGDGINDAPALSRAHVGVAMGGLGSDIALNAADIVLMNDRVERLPSILRLGQKTNRIIWSNLVFAGGVMAVLSIGSVVLDLIAPEMHSALLPMAVVGHEGSTVLVILNGLRLLRGP